MKSYTPAVRANLPKTALLRLLIVEPVTVLLAIFARRQPYSDKINKTDNI